MTHELVLTSVSQGLLPDSQGFCVVAADREISPALVKRLSSLSSYDHLLPPDSDQAKYLPINYSHLIVPTPDSSWHVLSRIAPTGWDYRYQPNQLAHHVAFKDEERTVEGPAWLLALSGFHFTEWLTPPVQFDFGRMIPTLTAPPPLTRRQRIARERSWLDPDKIALTIPAAEEADSLRAMARENEEQLVISGPPSTPCSSWQEFTGDAGWGAILAETVRTGREAIVVFRPGMNILPLFVEALALLPREQAWKTTFSTYYTQALEHAHCQWKGVVEGTEAAKGILQRADQLVIDLTRPMGDVPPGSYVNYARHGIENMLPTNENDDSVFEENEFDTKPFAAGNESVESGSANQTTVFQQSVEDTPPSGSSFLSAFSDPDPSPNPSLSALPAQEINIRARSSQKDSKGLNSLLGMKSRGQFYLLYGTTLALLLFLLALVADQFVDFGLTRLLLGKSTHVANDSSQGSNGGAAGGNTVGAGDGALSDVNIEREKKRLAQEQQRKAENEKRRLQQLKEMAQKARTTFEENARQAALDLSSFLSDHALPQYLDLKLPEVKDQSLILPKEPQIFSELAQLNDYGLAVQLELEPLLELSNVAIKTRKLRFNLKPQLQATTKSATMIVSPETESADTEDIAVETNDNEMANPGPLDDLEEGGNSLDMLPHELEPEIALESDAQDELSIPNDKRFEWVVFAMDKPTGNETPMFHLALTDQGLKFRWLRDGLLQQYFSDTLWASLGFLRICVEGERDQHTIASIPLFQPRKERPVYPVEQFTDPQKPEWIVDMPFAREPWRTLLRNDPPPFSLRLEVKVEPEILSGVESFETTENLPESEFLVNIKSTISSISSTSLRRNTESGQNTYKPIEVFFKGVASPEKIVWTDTFETRMNELEIEKEAGQTKLSDLKKKLKIVADDIFNKGNSAPRELRLERNELHAEITGMETRMSEIDSILTNLPTAHQKIIESKELRFEYAVHLLPTLKESDASPNEDEDFSSSVKRLKNEKSILLVDAILSEMQLHPKNAVLQENQPDEMLLPVHQSDTFTEDWSDDELKKSRSSDSDNATQSLVESDDDSVEIR